MAVRFGGTGGVGGITSLTIGVGATAITGGTSGRILFETGSPVVLGDSANLTFASNILQIGSADSTATTGWKIGTAGALIGSGYAAIWNANLTPSSTNWAFTQGPTGDTVFNSAIGSPMGFQLGGLSKMLFSPISGAGPAISAGTATTDVAALSITRTNNNAAVATGVKWTFTDTSSAAGFLPFQILGGAAGTTNLLSLGKTGTLTLGDLLVLNGYTVASLPTGIDGAIAMVTDQLTSVAAKGVAPTGGGSVHCAVIYNSSAWVGI